MTMDSLKALHTALLDTNHGYEEALKDAEPSDAVRIYSEMLALHTHDHGEVHAALVAAGEKPDDTGSFMSTVHETVIKVRSIMTGLGTNALPAFSSGEEMLLEKYDDALKESADDPTRTAMLHRQKGALSKKISEMKAIAI